MSASVVSLPRRPVAPASRKRTRGVLSQVRAAAGSPVSATFGALVGGIVPGSAYALAHSTVSLTLVWELVRWLLVSACLAFSAPTVYEWARQAFGSRRTDWLKAAGFVVLLEGVLICASRLGVHWLGTAALVYLVTINAIAVACRFAGEQ